MRGEGADPEGEAVLADSVGVALLVVLDTLTPAERLVFVLHDLFALPFDEIGPIVGRSSHADRARQRDVMQAFLRATRAGDLEGLLAVLDPDAIIRIDATSPSAAPAHRDGGVEAGTAREIKDASTWAKQMIALSRGRHVLQPALINGSVGLILAPSGRLCQALIFGNTKLTRIEAIGDPARLRELEIAVF